MEEVAEKKLNIAIIGRGNVGTHLYNALNGVEGSAVSLHSHADVGDERVRTADMVLLCIKDDKIAEVAATLDVAADAFVCHTSGTAPMDILSNFKNHGVFYPLQTFTKDVPLEYSEIPFFIEASSDAVALLMKRVAGMISPKVYDADSDTRRWLHISAVFACNFTVRLMEISDNLLKERGLDFDVLKPLVAETIRKSMAIGPAEALTGPAARGDIGTIASHIEALADFPEAATVYSEMTKSIMSRKDKK